MAVLLSSQSRPGDERANGAREQVALSANTPRAALGRDDRRAPSVRNHVHGALAHHGRVAQVQGQLGRVFGQRVRCGNFASLGICSAQQERAHADPTFRCASALPHVQKRPGCECLPLLSRAQAKCD